MGREDDSGMEKEREGGERGRVGDRGMGRKLRGREWDRKRVRRE